MSEQCHCGKDGHALNSVNCPVHGWKPPVIYDVMEDKTRIATQGDIDRLVLVERAYRRAAMVVHETFRDLSNGNVHVFNGRALYDGPAKADS